MKERTQILFTIFVLALLSLVLSLKITLQAAKISELEIKIEMLEAVNK